jgi:hypothetical protein
MITLARKAVFGLLGNEAAASQARRVMMHEFGYGTHWLWRDGEEFFLPAGVERLAEWLDGAGFGLEATLLRARLAEAERSTAAATRERDDERRHYWWERD